MAECKQSSGGSGLDELSPNLGALADTLANVKTTLHDTHEEWLELQRGLAAIDISQALMSPDDVIVSKTSLHKTAMEVHQMKLLLPQRLNQTLLASTSQLRQLQEESEKMATERDQLKGEVVHCRKQLAAAVAQVQTEKQIQLSLQVNLRKLTDQLAQQSEFSFSLGSVCGSILWALSRHEDCIHTMVAGSKSGEFLALVSSSVSSYLSTYMGDADQWPDPGSDEVVFILALCGTVTNMAASALGREYLSSSAQGQQVMRTFLAFIKDAPLGTCVHMKSLMLMFLYNISINHKGVKFLCSQPGLISMLCWHLTEEKDTENQVNTLRLLHSLISDQINQHVIHEVKENLSLCQLQQLTTCSNKLIQELSLDIITDLKQLDTEQ